MGSDQHRLSAPQCAGLSAEPGEVAVRASIGARAVAGWEQLRPARRFMGRHWPHSAAELALLIAAAPPILEHEWRVALALAAVAAWLVHGAVLESEHFGRRQDRQEASRITALAANALRFTDIDYTERMHWGPGVQRMAKTTLAKLGEGRAADATPYEGSSQEMGNLASCMDQLRERFLGYVTPHLINLEPDTRRLVNRVDDALIIARSCATRLDEVVHGHEALRSHGLGTDALARHRATHIEPINDELERSVVAADSGARSLEAMGPRGTFESDTASHDAGGRRKVALTAADDAAQRIAAEGGPSEWLRRSTLATKDAGLREIAGVEAFDFALPERPDAWAQLADSLRASAEALKTVDDVLGTDLFPIERELIHGLLEKTAATARGAGALAGTYRQLANPSLTGGQAEQLNRSLADQHPSFRAAVDVVLRDIDRLHALARGDNRGGSSESDPE